MRQKASKLCITCNHLPNFGIWAFIWSLVWRSWVSDCRYQVCQPLNARHGVKKPCQTWHRVILALNKTMPCLASFFDDMSGVKMLTNCVPGIDCLTSANEASIIISKSNDRGSGRRPPLPRSRPPKIGNGRPPEVVYIPQARFTSLSLFLRRFWSISNSSTAMKRSSFDSYNFVLHDAENRMPKFEIL